MAIQTINPATGEVVKTFGEFSDEKVNQIIDEANEAFIKWRETPFSFRKTLMLNAAKELKINKKKYADVLTLEMGKPIKQALSEVEKCAWVCEYYAENAEDILSKEVIKSDASESYVRFDPVGIVLAIMPWNFPYWQVFRFAAPALMAGNVGLLKHASNVPMSAMAIEEVFLNAGFPKNVFINLLIGSSKVKLVLDNPLVKAATLTGSENAGKKVAETAGNNLKKTVLELGGSDPFIILADADIEAAVDQAVTSRLINNGQSCIAAKRFIVVEEIADKFIELFVEKMEKTKVGDPADMETELGPIAREDLLIELDEQVKSSVKTGAKILTGGKRLERKGSYYPATVLTNVKKGMTAYKEELFGPVASVIVAEDEDEAINIANDSEFGLGSSLWTNDIDKAKKLAAKIEAGSVFINGMVKSDPRLPFGGIKMSGYGRELSHYGIKEFVNIKTVWIKA
ncbi:MAG: NAD-dependent succinate-semialdehyde dehydrogenase [Ignavibacteriae bacterium]|nr:NAD-dependent succinate-semialdehyde dehydrogenase [Ignavibacteriota bacterium]NOG98023.1 NAD-dependent succinate-semialdehyde dehydrogenase [Ignavibacteriota bacterium]